MRSAFRRHPYLASAFALFAVLALVFLFNVVSGLIYWSVHEDEPIRPWMTVGYVGHSWGLDPRRIDQAAGTPLPGPGGHPMTLAEIARTRGVPVAQVMAEVQAAVADLIARREAGRPPPPDAAPAE